MSLHIQNLGMIITEKCNLNCAHCLRGKCTNKVMSDEVIEATLNQVVGIGNLAICGGEPTLALDRLEKIFSYIIEKNIYVEQVTLTINGTIYSDELLRLLDYIEEYINYKKVEEVLSTFTISWDKFHYDEVKKLNMIKEYIENINRYIENKHYYAMQTINKKLFREGNAELLNPKITVPLCPMGTIITYAGNDKKFNRENGMCNIGPIVAVNVDGIMTECDSSIKHQRTIYNYGNVLTDSIEEVYLNKSKIVVPSKWSKETGKQMKKYKNYKR